MGPIVRIFPMEDLSRIFRFDLAMRHNAVVVSEESLPYATSFRHGPSYARLTPPLTQVVREYAAAALVIMQGSVHTALSSFDLGATPDPYKLPEVCTPEIKLPNFAAVTIPMASMRKGGLYEFRDTLCTKAEDPLQAAVTDVRATAEFQPGIAAQAGIAPVQLAGSPGFESP